MKNIFITLLLLVVISQAKSQIGIEVNPVHGKWYPAITLGYDFTVGNEEPMFIRPSLSLSPGYVKGGISLQKYYTIITVQQRYHWYKETFINTNLQEFTVKRNQHSFITGVGPAIVIHKKLEVNAKLGYEILYTGGTKLFGEFQVIWKLNKVEK